ncbi:hypothetical protein TNCV_4803831 [Trichonephila clavipes]|nr:hypothetical protein TNCV_4803831 [Trichonephila clavipes]
MIENWSAKVESLRSTALGITSKVSVFDPKFYKGLQGFLQRITKPGVLHQALLSLESSPPPHEAGVYVAPLFLHSRTVLKTKLIDATSNTWSRSIVPVSFYATLGVDVHEQMFRSGQSEAKPPVFSF